MYSTGETIFCYNLKPMNFNEIKMNFSRKYKITFCFHFTFIWKELYLNDNSIYPKYAINIETLIILPMDMKDMLTALRMKMWSIGYTIWNGTFHREH